MRIVFSVIVLLFVILLSYKIAVGVSTLTEPQQAWMDYFNGGEMPTGYSGNAVSHMQDVDRVMMFMEYVFYGLLLIGTLLLTYYKRNRKEVRRLLKYSGITTVVTVVLLGLVSFLWFDIVFESFHAIFFPQGNWMFPMDSLLIQTFPPKFFVTMTMKIFGIAFGIGIVFILVSYYLKDDRKSART